MTRNQNQWTVINRDGDFVCQYSRLREAREFSDWGSFHRTGRGVYQDRYGLTVYAPNYFTQFELDGFRSWDEAED